MNHPSFASMLAEQYEEAVELLKPIQLLLLVSPGSQDYDNVIRAVRGQGHEAARALLELAKTLPIRSAGSDIEFVIGYKPLMPPPAVEDKALRQWHEWLSALYGLCLQDNLQQADLKRCQAFLAEFHRISEAIGPFITSRIGFWQKERGRRSRDASTTRYT